LVAITTPFIGWLQTQHHSLVVAITNPFVH